MFLDNKNNNNVTDKKDRFNDDNVNVYDVDDADDTMVNRKWKTFGSAIWSV